MAAASIPIPDSDLRWSLPSRGRVGMYCLIAADLAIFTIFVVAYLFYIGKSLTGPKPADVLHAPIFYTVCLTSQLKREHAKRVEILSMYWHFVDAVWVIVFTVVYVIGK